MIFKRLVSQIKFDEGLSLMPYFCTSDKLTIGIGRNIQDNGITKDEALFMFENDVKRTIKELATSLSKKFDIDINSLSHVRQEVLINMCFQLGSKRLFKFKKTFKYIKLNDFEKASYEMLDSLWAKQTPKRANRLAYAMKNNKFKKERL